MMKLLQTLAPFAAIALPMVAALPTAATTRTVIQFSNPTWLENVAPARNGSLLVSVIGRAEVLLIHDPTLVPATSSILATFPNRTSVLGITEYEPDVFAIAVGSTTPDNQPVEGTFGIWRIDLANKGVSKITDTPSLGLLNGMAALNKDTILVADSWRGNIVKLDVKTKKYGVVLEDASLKSNFSAPSLPLGVNGLRLHGDYLYYSNTVQRLIGRVKIDKKTGKAAGPYHIIAQGQTISVPDDFAVAKDGSVYLTSPLAAPEGDTLQKVSLNGKVELVAKVDGPTAAQFGRTSRDKNVLYLSSMGGFGANGAPKQGGKVIAVNLSK